ncbi:MAG: hypothetical protein AAGC46_14870 [Solirubrobacteraceae bacterium]|nr:hypothetical protein [Patulibacter sp.]
MAQLSGFFDDADETAVGAHRPYVEPEWQRIPHEVLPTQLPLNGLLAHGRDIALVLTTVTVYPTGLVFSVRAVRHPEAEGFDHDLSGAMHAFSNPTSADRFRLGIEYADGRRATNDFPGGASGPHPPETVLRDLGGGGSADGAGATYWAWPIPADGDLEIVYAWPGRDVPEGRYTLDGATLRAAAAAATPVWPATDAASS